MVTGNQRAYGLPDNSVPRDGVVVIAATNLPDRVDSALRRLDRVIVIPRPDEMALAGIVAHHLNVDVDADADPRDQGFGLKGDKKVAVANVRSETRLA